MLRLMTARESDSLTIKPDEFWINAGLQSQRQKVDWSVKHKLVSYPRYAYVTQLFSPEDITVIVSIQTSPVQKKTLQLEWDPIY